MGRWAEVYFTNPPEKREEAVLELLRELEADNSHRDREPAAQPAAPDSPVYNPSPEAINLRPEPSATPALPTLNGGAAMHCGACGRDNPAGHKFCGMCGARLAPADAAAASGNQPGLAPQDVAEQQNPEPAFETSYYATSNANGLSLFQNTGETNYEDPPDWEYEPAPAPRYRIYIGVALAVVILALGYFAWHGAQTAPTSQGPLPPPPAATKDAEPAAAAPKAGEQQTQPAPSPQNSDKAASGRAPSKTADETAASAAESNPAEKPAEKKEAGAFPAARAEEGTPAQPLPANASSGNGDEELAVAERYLTGTSGQGRDSAEAAKWLWKSIAKHNSEATMLLADLYLKGDGVSKNCDQARVLLDSAARKGMAGAGERLRNLQAFGCQ